MSSTWQRMFAGRTCAVCASVISSMLILAMYFAIFSPVASAHPLQASTQAIPASAYRTYEYSYGKPSITFCNGYMYLAWASTQNPGKLNISFGPNAQYVTQTVVTFNEYLYRNLNASQSTGPALTCWKSTLYVAWTGTDEQINTGFFDGYAADNYIQNKRSLGVYSYRSPALTGTSDGILNVAWTGTNGQINVKRASDGSSWGPIHNWSSQTASSGPGFSNACYSTCYPYISWVGTDSTHQLNIGYFNTSSASFVKIQSLGGYHMNSGASDDASLAVEGPYLYIGFENNTAGYLSVGSTSNPAGFWAETNTNSGQGSYGMGVATASNNDTWFSYTNNLVDPNTGAANTEIVVTDSVVSCCG